MGYISSEKHRMVYYSAMAIPSEVFPVAPMNCGAKHKFEVREDTNPITPPWVFIQSAGAGHLSPDECSDFVPILPGEKSGYIRVTPRELSPIERLLGQPACQVYCLVRCQDNVLLTQDRS